MSKGLREGTLFRVVSAGSLSVAFAHQLSPQDPGWSHRGPLVAIHNYGGVVGAWFADVFLYLFGYFAYLFPLMVGFSGWLVFRGRTPTGGIDVTRSVASLGGFSADGGFGLRPGHSAFPYCTRHLPLDAGGVFGNLVGNSLAALFSFMGATLFLVGPVSDRRNPVYRPVLAECHGLDRQDDAACSCLAVVQFGRLRIYVETQRTRANAKKTSQRRRINTILQTQTAAYRTGYQKSTAQ